MSDQPSLARLMSSADVALQEYRWAEAQQLYQQVLDLHPNDNKASEKLYEVKRKEAADLKIQTQDRGPAFLANGQFSEASDAYVEAINIGGTGGVIYHHAQLEQQRKLANSLLPGSKTGRHGH